MIKIKAGWREPYVSLPDHIEHYDVGGAIVAVRPRAGLTVVRRYDGRDRPLHGSFDLTIAVNNHNPADGEHKTIDGMTRADAISLLYQLANGAIVELGSDGLDLFINQAMRECYVVRWTPTRVRLEYELPRSGLTGCWRKWMDLGNGYRLVKF